MVEATNRIQELEYKVEMLEKSDARSFELFEQFEHEFEKLKKALRF